MASSLLAVGRLGFLLLLTSLHLWLFALPAVQQFLAGDVTTVETRGASGPIPAPAITLCPMANHQSAWKNATGLNWVHNFAEHCNSSTTAAQFVSCVERGSLGLEDIIPYVPPHGLGASHGRLSPENPEVGNLTDEKFWAPSVTLGNFARCFTLRDPTFFSGTNTEKENIIIALNPKYAYYSLVHNPDFYLFNYNVMTMPLHTEILFFDANSSVPKTKVLVLERLRHEKINREDLPCKTDPAYSFSYCVQKNISETLGCTLPWGNFSLGGSSTLYSSQPFRWSPPMLQAGGVQQV